MVSCSTHCYADSLVIVVSLGSSMKSSDTYIHERVSVPSTQYQVSVHWTSPIALNYLLLQPAAFRSNEVWAPRPRTGTNRLFLVIVQQQEFLLWMANNGSDACKSKLTALQLVLEEYWGGKKSCVFFFFLNYTQRFLNLCGTWIL